MDRKYSGVTIGGHALQISFTVSGQRIREYIRCGRHPTKVDLKRAWELRCAIVRDIDLGNFEYRRYFPNGTNNHRFDERKSTSSIEPVLNEWVKQNQKNWAYSTTLDYLSAIRTHLTPKFGHLYMGDLTRDLVNDWINSLDISPKRINNILVPLRMIHKEAYLAGELEYNVMQRVKNLKTAPRQPKPFSINEILRILSQLEGQTKDIIQFGFFSGLRTSELIALKWSSVDLPNNRIWVDRAVVRGREKSPKTASGRRFVELCFESISALQDQRMYSLNSEEVFLDPKYNAPWKSDQPLRKRVWVPAVKRAGVTYREQYQMRHTYASLQLMSGKDPMWVDPAH